ncbi:MAG: IgA Peptidase M64 [Verrucomicrobiales bacterium]
MKRSHLLFLAIFLMMGVAFPSLIEAANASPKTMRLDYYHSGNATQELFSIDRIVQEPLEWPGNLQKPIDEMNLGKYLFEVRDKNSNRLLYSRGFNSIYGEWETTGEAQRINRTFQESLRFPFPEEPVQVLIKKRDAQNLFREAWSLLIDPKDMFIEPGVVPHGVEPIILEQNGAPGEKVDFLILGDGYRPEEREKFEKRARRLVEALFSRSPFKERRKEFNVWALCPPAKESGVSRPSTGIHVDSPVGTSYDAFGSERYLLTYNNRAFRNIAQAVPYEFVEIITNTRTYGGGGIFNLYGTVSADSSQAEYVFVHEFGHHFAELADEYYTSPVAYSAPSHLIEPWEPNVTALLDPKNLKWKDLINQEVPLPTPWPKEEYEKFSREYQAKRAKLRAENKPEEEMEGLFKEARETEQRIFGGAEHRSNVGAFEGAMYQAKGYYRPQLDCIMFTRSPNFCKVCARHLNRVIDFYSGNGKQENKP